MPAVKRVKISRISELGAYALGYVDDTRDPIEVVRPDLARTGFRPVLASSGNGEASGFG